MRRIVGAALVAVGGAIVAAASRVCRHPDAYESAMNASVHYENGTVRSEIDVLFCPTCGRILN